MRILTAVGARPQFIKAAPVNLALQAAGHEDVIVHSGQHYDDSMSEVFFRELGIPAPQRNLNAGSGSHAEQTAAMLVGYEKAILDYSPDLVLVHGDTNSTLAAALAACKLGVALAHNEAGLRSFNKSMPEEYNRLLTDHCSDLLFCPTYSASLRLQREGISAGVYVVGDVMADTARIFSDAAAGRDIPQSFGLTPGAYALATLHRAYTIDDAARVRRALQALGRIGLPVLLPLHPRMRARMEKEELIVPRQLVLTDPLGYLDMTAALKSAHMVFTDSGGLQKEAYIHGVPCVTLRPETEWTETVEAGWNRIVDLDEALIAEAAACRWWPAERPELFGDGHAAERILEHITVFRKSQ